MNEFETAVRAHDGDSDAGSIIDVCFAAGWLAALDAVARSGNASTGGGHVGRLRAQASDYEHAGGDSAELSKEDSP